jgi:hypothetical protein
MRVAAVPAPLGASPGAAVVVAIELPVQAAIEAGNITFRVIAVDVTGQVRARQQFNSTFKANVVSPAGWARIRSQVEVPSGRYQIRVAAVGADGRRGSVFTETEVPKFDTDLALGGLSSVAPGTVSSANKERSSSVVELAPLAARDVLEHTTAAAQLPIRVARKAATAPLSITATLVSADGKTVQVDHAPRADTDYATPAGDACRIAIPGLATGDYRLVVEATLGRARKTREMSFRVVRQ